MSPTITRRILVPASELAKWQADGYREIYRTPGAMRLDGEAVVMEWRAEESLSH